MIIIVFGLPGSGKSYFASRLAKMINGEYINSDTVRKKMFDKRTYSIKERSLVYDEMLRQVREEAKTHKYIILDATFYKDDLRKKFSKEAKNIDEVIFIEVRAEENVVRKRLEKARKESEANFGVYKKIENEWEPLIDEHLILQSTDDNIHDMLEKTFDYLHLKNDKRANQ
jgi:predicted kinase